MVTDRELEVIHGLLESLSSLMNGKAPQPLPAPESVSEEVSRLCSETNKLIAAFGESHHFINRLAQGDLDVDPPPRNMICSPYKQLQANLRHLVWQTEQVANGDLSQQVDFLGRFAEAFNSMILSLREKRALEAALKRSHEELEFKVEERTSELRRSNEKLRTEIAERKQAQKALRKSEERFRTIFEAAEDYIFLKDLSLRYLDVNPAVEKLFGLPSSEITGRNYTDLFGKEGLDREREVDIRVLGGQSVQEEHTRRVNGVPMTFLDTKVPLRDDSGEIVGILIIARDITDRKRLGATIEAPGAYTSSAMRSTLAQARIAAKTDATLVLLGESGSGKDYLAKYIHDQSSRTSGPYFSINCAAIAPHLAESEVFGHEKGAFTGAQARKRGLFELAEGGTLLLNEIGELSLPMQAKLLTFLDTRKFTRVGGEKEVHVNARLIAATNRDLEKEVRAGAFRKDLFYRINVMSISVPPLRERVADLPILAQEILSELKCELQLTAFPEIDAATMERLKGYHWPGNVRELRNWLERAAILSGGGPLKLDLPTSRTANDQHPHVTFSPQRPLHEVTDEVTKKLCAEALDYCQGNKKSAARLLGISRDTLYRYMKRFGMEIDD